MCNGHALRTLMRPTLAKFGVQIAQHACTGIYLNGITHGSSLGDGHMRVTTSCETFVSFRHPGTKTVR